MTDYGAPSFGQRFHASRPLDDATARTWVDVLRLTAPGPRDTVIDLGSGTGRFWEVLRQVWHPRRILAVERSGEMSAASPRAPDVEIIPADIDSARVEALRADAIFCSMSLHYSEDPASLCRRLRDVVGDAGVLCVRTACLETVTENLLIRTFPSALRAEQRAFPPRVTIEGWVRGAGFDTTSLLVSTAAAPGYWQFVRRAARRGVPSLQLVPRGEFLVGLIRLAWRVGRLALSGAPLPDDVTLLVIGTTT